MNYLHPPTGIATPLLPRVLSIGGEQREHLLLRCLPRGRNLVCVNGKLSPTRGKGKEARTRDSVG
jgi:hypothetical protein